jgi:hypothetical protein
VVASCSEIKWQASNAYVHVVWMQFTVGQCVHMMNARNNKQKVASGQISGGGGGG